MVRRGSGTPALERRCGNSRSSIATGVAQRWPIILESGYNEVGSRDCGRCFLYDEDLLVVSPDREAAIDHKKAKKQKSKEKTKEVYSAAIGLADTVCASAASEVPLGKK